MKTGVLPLSANRWEPFVFLVDFVGVNWTGATFLLQVRATRDASGSPLVSLTTTSTVGAEGIRITGVTTDSAGIPTTSISIRINEATMEALPEPIEIGDDLPLFYDLQATPSGGNKFRYLEGEFVVHAGVTH